MNHRIAKTREPNLGAGKGGGPSKSSSSLGQSNAISVSRPAGQSGSGRASDRPRTSSQSGPVRSKFSRKMGHEIGPGFGPCFWSAGSPIVDFNTNRRGGSKSKPIIRPQFLDRQSVSGIAKMALCSTQDVAGIWGSAFRVEEPLSLQKLGRLLTLLASFLPDRFTQKTCGQVGVCLDASLNEWLGFGANWRILRLAGSTNGTRSPACKKEQDNGIISSLGVAAVLLLALRASRGRRCCRARR